MPGVFWKPHIKPTTRCLPNVGTALKTVVQRWAMLESISNVLCSMGRCCLPQQTRRIHPKLFQCWASVEDAGPTLKEHWVNVPYLVGLNCVGVWWRWPWLNVSCFLGLYSLPHLFLTYIGIASFVVIPKFKLTWIAWFLLISQAILNRYPWFHSSFF